MGRAHRPPVVGRHRRPCAPPLRSRQRRGRGMAAARQSRRGRADARPDRVLVALADRLAMLDLAGGEVEYSSPPPRPPRPARQRRLRGPRRPLLGGDDGRGRVARQGRAVPLRGRRAHHDARTAVALQRARLGGRPHVLRRLAHQADRRHGLRRRDRQPSHLRDDRGGRRRARRPRRRRRGRRLGRALRRRAGAALQPRRRADREARGPGRQCDRRVVCGQPAVHITARSPQPLGGSLFVAEPGVTGPAARIFAG